MAILEVIPVTGSRSRIDEYGESEYSRTFKVVTDSPLVGSKAVRLATGIPRLGNVYVSAGGDEMDSGAVAKEISDQQDSENPRLWVVTVNYGQPTADSQQSNPNPLERPAIISWGSHRYTLACAKDINGRPITNSAGEEFDPPAMTEASNPVVTITRNQVTYNPQIGFDYEDATNSDSFLGFEAGKARMAGISAHSQTENNVFFWSVSYEIHFRRDGWKLELLDQGRNELNPFGDLVPIYQRNEAGILVRGLQVVNSVPLDKQGRELSKPTPAKAKFMDYTIHRSMPFAALGLP